MKMTIKFYFILFFLVPIFGCNEISKNRLRNEVGTVKVQVVSSSSPKQSSDSTATIQSSDFFNFETVELMDIYDLATLTGKYVNFYVNASNSSDNQIYGTQPKLSFLKSKSGVFIPRNILTLQASTLYYTTQKLFELDAKLGAENINSKPRKIVLNAKTNLADLKENNAFYDGNLDAVIFLNYQGDNLSIALNPGIYAHEHFHSLFYNLLQKKIKLSKSNSAKIFSLHQKNPTSIQNSIISNKNLASDSSNIVLDSSDTEKYYTLILRGLNEGLADFWGWNYSLDSNFIIHSIPSVKQARNLMTVELKDLTFDSISTLQNRLTSLNQLGFEKSSDAVVADSYLLGTKYAVLFKELTTAIKISRKITQEEAFIVVTKSIISNLSNLTDTLINSETKSFNVDLPSPAKVAFLLSRNIQFLDSEECHNLYQVLNKDSQLNEKIACTKNSESEVLLNEIK